MKPHGRSSSLDFWLRVADDYSCEPQRRCLRSRYERARTTYHKSRYVISAMALGDMELGFIQLSQPVIAVIDTGPVQTVRLTTTTTT